MILERNWASVFGLLSALLGIAAIPSPVVQAATLVIINNNAPGEGLNDPTPAASVGGNTGTTLGAQRLIAFQYAADFWGTRLSSSVTIQVGASFDPLTCSSTSAVLGSAGAFAFVRDFAGAPAAGTWYPVGLANALNGSDLDLSNPDITAQFNSSIGTTCPFPSTWYYGLDGNPPGGQIDFVTVLLHELAHGLGFVTIVDLASGSKALGFNDTFMLNLENHGAIPPDYPGMTDAQRVAASTATGALHWVGANVEAASCVLTAGKVGNHVQMFAPNPQQPGSSVSHWDTALTPDQLLEPIYTGPNQNPVLELPLFQDIGWTVLTGPALQVTPATSIAASGTRGGPFSPSSFTYMLSATIGSFNYSISGVPGWLTPSSTSGTASTCTSVTFTVNATANSLAPGTYGPATITFTNTDTGQGTQARTATLTVNPRALQVTPSTNIAASGQQGGPFTPSSFSYSLSAVMGSPKYSITNLPSWLTASPTSGTVTTRATTVTFRINTTAVDRLSASTYVSSINFNDTTNNQVTTRTATLTVAPKNYTVKVSAYPTADGTVTGGGTFAGGTSDTVTATPKSGHTFLHWTKNGAVVSTSPSYTFTMPSANVALVADFR
jgi:hypothetical protein